jgi:hypothetical protein
MAVIFETSKEELRHWLRGPRNHSSVVTNVIRLCMRRPYTLPELAGLSLTDRRATGLPLDYWGSLSEINVTVVIGECRNRELLVEVGEESGRGSGGGAHIQWRTSLLAFFLCPELAVLEPAAYSDYLTAAHSDSEAREFFLRQFSARSLKLSELEGSLLFDWQRLLLLSFPSLMEYGFAATSERPGLGEVPEASVKDRQRIFGYYFIAKLPTVGDESSQNWLQRAYHLWRGLQVALPAHVPVLQAFLAQRGETLRLLLDRLLPGWAGHWMLRLVERKLPTQHGGAVEERSGSNPVEIARIEDRALLADRLKPVPIRPLFS